MAPRYRHHAAKRKLMRWRHVGERRCGLRKLAGIQSVLVNRDRHRSGAGCGKRLPYHQVTGVLDQERSPGSSRRRAHTQPLLRAGNDDDLVEIVSESSAAPRITLQRQPKPFRAERIIIGLPYGSACDCRNDVSLPRQHGKSGADKCPYWKSAERLRRGDSSVRGTTRFNRSP